MRPQPMVVSVLLLAAISLPPAVAQGSGPDLSFARARRVMDAAVGHARAHNAPGGAIAVVDAGGALVLFERLDGTFARVREAFAKGQPLVESSGFKVNPSRRDGPGEAEVHERDTDIFYVLDGRATLVTGGRLVGGRETSDGEIRGSEIVDGQPRTLGQGDVVVIPRGVPHWFSEVVAPFTYYTVKVTGEKS